MITYYWNQRSLLDRPVGDDDEETTSCPIVITVDYVFSLSYESTGGLDTLRSSIVDQAVRVVRVRQ